MSKKDDALKLAIKQLEADEAYIMCMGGNGNQQREAAAACREALTADDNDFPLGQACDLSGEGTCEACQ